MSLKGKASPPSPAPLLKNAAAAPVIYFDGVPAVGIFAGNVEMELSVRILLPSRDGVSVLFDQMCVAHLRCSPAAAKLLVDTAARILAIPAPEGGDKPKGDDQLN